MCTVLCLPFCNLSLLYSLHNEDSCSASILEELQIDPDKMRGDAIGDTVYSERYVIKLLMKLTEVCMCL